MAEKRKIASESIADKQQKSGDPNDPNYILVKFVNQENEETFLRVSRNAKLAKAFTAYSQHHKLQHKVTFTFDGLNVNPSLTANDLNLKDGDAFDVFGYLNGGGCIEYHGTGIPF